MSTLALEDGDLVVDGHTLRTNFQGRAFDETAFVKIDLVFAEASAGQPKSIVFDLPSSDENHRSR
jgi:hypothetical protein